MKIHKLLTIMLLTLAFSGSALAQAWVARHGLSAADYQAEVNKWTAQGYRPVQLSGYSDRFSVIFEKQANAPAWVARHGLSSADYQAEVNKWTGQGYRPVRVSGYASGNQARYAAIFEKRANTPAWVARHGLNAQDYQAEFTKWTAQGYKPTDISAYTVGGQDLYAVIFEKTPNPPAWVARHALTAAGYQTEFNKWTAQGYRPVIVSANGAGRYAAVWEKTGTTAWVARHGLTWQQYQDDFERMFYQGFRPVWVNGATVGSNDSYAAVWESKETFRGDEMKKVDDAVAKFMNQYNVPGLSFAMTKDGRLVLAKTYGFADKETGERVAPRHRFRIASVSKPITATAIMKLFEANKLKMSDKVFGSGAILGTTYGTQPYKTNVDKITVEHLLNHTAGGWAGDLGFDPMFNYTNQNHAGLISKTLDEQALQKTPGTEYHYSNFGYCVLGRVIEKLSGQTYPNYVKNQILIPSGITSMEIAGDTEADRKPSEVKYYGQNGGNPYNMKIARMDAHGGWIATPIDLTRFLVRVDQFSTKPDILKSTTLTSMFTGSAANGNYAKGWSVNSAPNYWHNGSLAGEQAFAVRTADGFTWAVLVNTAATGNFTGDLDQLMWTVKNSITFYPSHDLF
ncbi:MAG TPA: serine hydrolase [Pyrinomonadaceae bacterium]|jgi:CubicO group peptidase (beta-lactamase class C family)